MTAKEELISMINRLPDKASTAGIREELELAMNEEEIVQAIQEGLADLEAGRVKTAEEVQAAFNSWVAAWKK